MDEQLLFTLLKSSEGETLDFKQSQYPFDGASDEEKSELLKDVLAFANAWRLTDAYIVIGVTEKDQRAELVIGADILLSDHCLQQFVNTKTNKPVIFSVHAVLYEGKNLNVICIDQKQSRPIYLKKQFGKVPKEAVYLRRGSTKGIASPDEIAEMGRSEALAMYKRNLEPDVELQLSIQRETWVPFLPIRRQQPEEAVVLEIIAANKGPGTASHVEGSVKFDARLLWDPDWHTKTGTVSFPIQNRKLVKDGLGYESPAKELTPILPQRQIRVARIRLLSLPNEFPSEELLMWEVSADNAPKKTRAALFSSLATLDCRND